MEKTWKNKHVDSSKLGHRALVKGAFQPPSFPGSVPCPFCPPSRYLGAHELLHTLVEREGCGRKAFSHNETCVTPGIPIDFNGGPGGPNITPGIFTMVYVYGGPNDDPIDFNGTQYKSTAYNVRPPR